MSTPTPDPPAAPLTAEEIAALREQYGPENGLVHYEPQIIRLIASHTALRDRLARTEERCVALEGAATILTAAMREVIRRVPNTAVGRLTEAIREYDALLATPTAPYDGAARAGDAAGDGGGREGRA